MLSWLISFSLIIILPLDIYQNVNDIIYQSVKIIWVVLYWVTFCLTWFFLPITLEYESAGEFTKKQRFLKSLKINFIIYGIGLAAGIIFTIVLLIKDQFNFQKLLAFVVVLSNAVGLLIITFLLGYAMVAIPKQYYRESNHAIQLNNKYYLVAKTKDTASKQVMDLEEMAIEVLAYQSKYKNNSEFRPLIDIVLQNFSNDIIANAQTLRNKGQGGAISLDDLTADRLAELNKNTKELQLECTRNTKKLEMLMEQALFIEDVINCNTGCIESDVRPPRNGVLGSCIDKCQYIWYVIVWKYAMFSFFGISIGLAGIVLFAQISVFSGVDMNVFWHVLNPNQSFIAMQIIVLIPLLYVLNCVLYALLKIRFFNYGFYDYGFTDGPSLIFSATFVSRIAFPLAFNFLWMFRINDSDLTQVVGDFNFDVYLKQFKLVLPILLIVLLLFNIFDVYDKILRAIGITRFQFSESYDDCNVREGSDCVALQRKELAHALVNVEIKQPLL